MKTISSILLVFLFCSVSCTPVSQRTVGTYLMVSREGEELIYTASDRSFPLEVAYLDQVEVSLEELQEMLKIEPGLKVLEVKGRKPSGTYRSLYLVVSPDYLASFDDVVVFQPTLETSLASLANRFTAPELKERYADFLQQGVEVSVQGTVYQVYSF